MPQRYQIHRQKAIQKFRHPMVRGTELSSNRFNIVLLPIVLKCREHVLQEGVGNLLREAWAATDGA